MHLQMPPMHFDKNEVASQAIWGFYSLLGQMPGWGNGNPNTKREGLSKHNSTAFSGLIERCVSTPTGTTAAMKQFKYNLRQHGPLCGICMPPGWGSLPRVLPGSKVLQDNTSDSWLVLDPATFGPDGPAGMLAFSACAGEQQQEPLQLPDGAYVAHLEYVLHHITPIAK